MSFSYDASWSTDKDKVRFLIGDRVESGAVFQDEEINGSITIMVDIFMAASMLAYNRATELISQGIQYTIGSGVRNAISVDRRNIPEYWMALAKKMEDFAGSVGIGEAFDRFAFNITRDGTDWSDYQGSNGNYGWNW